MTEERFAQILNEIVVVRIDQVAQRIDALANRVGHLEEGQLAIKARLHDMNTRLGVVEELVVEIPAMNRRLARLDKRLKNAEVGLKITQVAVHDLSLETRKHNKQIDFLMKENLRQSQRISALIKQEEHHDNRIAILFERLAAT